MIRDLGFQRGLGFEACPETTSQQSVCAEVGVRAFTTQASRRPILMKAVSTIILSRDSKAEYHKSRVDEL